MPSLYQRKEKIAEIIARETIKRSSFSEGELSDYQQVILDGIVVQGAVSDEPIITYKSDLLGLAGLDAEDFNSVINNTQNVINGILAGDGPGGLNYVDGDMVNDGDTLITPPSNVSQFIGFQDEGGGIDPELANEVLNTNITELLPTQTSRQSEINNLFAQYAKLKPTELPPYCDENNGLPAGTFTVDVDGSCTGKTYQQWLEENSISTIQDLSDYVEGDDKNAFITRLVGEENGRNTNKSLEYLRDSLNDYLKDIDSETMTTFSDSRPEYNHTSQGYVEIRNLNQSIIVRRSEGAEVGIDESITLQSGIPIIEFNNNDPNQIWTALNYNSNYPPVDGQIFPKYLWNGFTITMWVKFLDKVNSGTLFNFGNPTRLINPMGFRLETFTVRDSDLTTSPPGTMANGRVPFSENNYERFVRLVVKEPDTSIRDSNFGFGTTDRIMTEALQSPALELNINNAFNYTNIPIDFDEWYFIAASYNPMVHEDNDAHAGYLSNYNYWNNNLLPDTMTAPDGYTNTTGADTTIHRSGLGSKCKVEIISKSDLLRARGYKPIDKT